MERTRRFCLPDKWRFTTSMLSPCFFARARRDTRTNGANFGVTSSAQRPGSSCERAVAQRVCECVVAGHATRAARVTARRSERRPMGAAPNIGYASHRPSTSSTATPHSRDADHRAPDYEGMTLGLARTFPAVSWMSRVGLDSSRDAGEDGARVVRGPASTVPGDPIAAGAGSIVGRRSGETTQGSHKCRLGPLPTTAAQRRPRRRK